MSAVVLVHAVLGSATITLSSPTIGVFLPIALFHLLDFSIAALAEELQDRGYVLRVIAEHHPRFAVLFTSAMFSVTHLGAAWLTPIALVNAFLMGCVLAVVFLKTRSLWATWGLHFGLNAFEEVVFQLPVKGYEDMAGHLFSYEFHAADWITGGAAGVVGSVVFTAAIITMMTVILWRWRPDKAMHLTSRDVTCK